MCNCETSPVQLNINPPEGAGGTAILDTDRNLYLGKLPPFFNREIIGYYSVLDSRSSFSRSFAALKYVIIPRPENRKVKFDLNHGLEKAIKQIEDGDEKMEFLPRWLTEEWKDRGEWLVADFVCYRGLLSMLMCTPYEKEEGWIICATRVNGSIFLFSKETEQKKAKREQMTEQQKTFFAWGYKFEQYMRSERPKSWPSIAEPVNEADEFIVMFKSRLNEHSLMYGAEIDGIESEEIVTDLEAVNLIELKTNRHFSSDRQYANFKRFKTIKWWAQSFLVGIQKIVCGFRDDRGMVHDLEIFEVMELPEMGKGLWDASVCMNFCEQFLSFVKNLLHKEDSPHVVWKFEWKPNENVTSARFEVPTDLCFLPEWFLVYFSSDNKSTEGVSNGLKRC